MSTKTLKMQDYQASSEQARAEMLHAFAKSINDKPNGEVQDLKNQIAFFENIYEIKSQDLLEEIKSGKREETYEMCKWLTLFNRLERHQGL
jgi:bacterioferritin (cytochrome b1)